MNAVLFVCVCVMGVAALLLLTRISRGPTMLDRAVALDAMLTIIVCGLALEAAVHRHTTTLPILVVVSLVGFVGSVSIARFTPGSDDVEAGQ